MRDNIILAREDSSDDAVWDALRAVGAAEWVERFPTALDTQLGSGNQQLTPAQAQQIALARLIIADPHTLVLDEATSLIDPRTARTLEGSMNALLEGRTVVAIAHRLHTAHDADRIAVVIDGRIVELGSPPRAGRAQGGEYAALWRAWTSALGAPAAESVSQCCRWRSRSTSRRSTGGGSRLAPRQAAEVQATHARVGR